VAGGSDGRPVRPRGDPHSAPGSTPVAVRRLSWLPLAAFVAVAAEIAVFITVGEAVGYLLTVLAVVAASLLGLALLGREGGRAWRRFRDAATAGRPPGEHVTDGLVGLAGALLLAVPGLLTGATGLALLTPPVRRGARAWIRSRAERRLSSATAGGLFGPRRVRVRWDPPQPARPQPDGPQSGVVEGEVLRPDRDPPG
jgi:UPF0716 protein FxsA